MIKESAKCPICKSDMVPFSEPHSTQNGDDYCLVYSEWRCVKCKYSISRNLDFDGD